MPDRKTDRMDLVRFGEIVEAYGADPGRWPPDERMTAEALLAGSDEARQLHADAAALDTLMTLSAAPRPSPELMAEVLADAGRSGRRGPFTGLWPFETVWRPVSALATAAVVGIALGIAAPDTVLPGPDDTDLVGEIESFAFGFDFDGESGA